MVFGAVLAPALLIPYQCVATLALAAVACLGGLALGFAQGMELPGGASATRPKTAAEDSKPKKRVCGCPQSGGQCSNIHPVGDDGLTQLCRERAGFEPDQCNCPCDACQNGAPTRGRVATFGEGFIAALGRWKRGPCVDSPADIDGRVPCDECGIGWRQSICDYSPARCFAWMCSRGGPPCYTSSN